MKLLLSVIKPDMLPALAAIHERLGIRWRLELFARGTASKTLLEFLAIDSHERRLVISLVDEAAASRLLREEARLLYLNAPGHGGLVALPIKSIGGRRTMAFLQGEQTEAGQALAKTAPPSNFTHELLVVICNEGYTDTVMDAARGGGARGGTVLHAKGTAAAEMAKFYQLSLADEKEIILIVAARDDKNSILSAIMRQAGAESPAGAICFSLPVTDLAGFGLLSD